MALAFMIGLQGMPRVSNAHHLEEVEEFSKGFFKEETLTGDWNGYRTQLQDKGWVFELEYIGDLFHNPLGGLRRQSDYAGFLEIDLHADLDRIAGLSHTRFLVDLIHLHGTEPSKNLGTRQTVSSLEDPGQFKVFQAWVERDWWNGRASLKGGIYSLDTEFDFKTSANLFVNGVFGTGLDLSETGVTGPAIFPNSALGVRAYLEPVERWYVQAAVLDGVPGNPNDPTGTHIRLDEDEGVQVVAEAGYKRIGRGERELKMAVGTLIYTTELPDFIETDESGHSKKHSGTASVYGFVDLPVTYEGVDPAQGANLFFRLGAADPDVAQFEFTLTGGVVYTGFFSGRPKDKMGLGVSGAWNGDKYMASQTKPIEGQEWVIEASYLLNLMPGIALQPNLQYFINPGSNPGLDNAFYLGWAFNLSF